MYIYISVTLASRQFQLFGWSDLNFCGILFNPLSLRDTSVSTWGDEGLQNHRKWRILGTAFIQDLWVSGTLVDAVSPPISKFSGDKNKSKWEILKRCFFEKDSNFRHEALGNKKRLLCHLSIMLFHCFCFNWIHFRGKNMFAIHNPDHKESDGQTDGLRKILNMP